MAVDVAAELDQQVVNVLQALAQPTRLRIIDLVSQAGPEGVAAGAIAKAVSAPASTLSFHLKELSQAGILEARPQGRFIYYTTRAEALRGVAAYVARWAPPAVPVPPEPMTTSPGPAPESEAGGGKRGTKAAKPKRPKGDEGQLSIFGE